MVLPVISQTLNVRRVALILCVLLLVPAFAAKGGKSSAKKKPAARKLSRVEQVKRDQARIARDWYRTLQERSADFPAAAVKDRKIVVDPGHTDCSPGAEGPKRRIIEADVNWGVARELVRLLNDAGAKAILTKHYGPPKPVEQRNTDADLDQRADVSNRESADLFVSVHHNWTGDPAVNRTEVYYRLEDDGPSRDAASYIQIHLSRNLGLDGSLLPANFRVLRVNTRPALLTEASYISNPIQESLLARPDKQQLEAHAIYLGILDYFARGVPEFRLLTSPGDIAPYPRPQLKVRVKDPSGIDRPTVKASFDGQPARVDYLPLETTFVIRPAQSLANGRHTFRFAGRNTRGNSGLPLATSFITDREPARITLTTEPRTCPPGDIAAEVSALVLDEDGQPVADTRRISFTIDRIPAGDSALSNGTARIYLRRDKPVQVAVSARCGRALASAQVTFARNKAPVVQFRILRDSFRTPVFPAGVRDDWREETVPANRDGIVTLQPAAGSHAFTFTAPGYRRRSIDLKLTEKSAAYQEFELEPVLAGALFGARIFLDPAGRYENPDTSHERADFNLALAGRLARLLDDCGATVQLSRTQYQYETRTERLERAGAFKPDYYLKLSCSSRGLGPKTRIGHYPGSSRGEGLARALAAQFGSVAGVADPEIAEDRANEVTNAPCPATAVYLKLTDTLARAPSDTLFQIEICHQLLLGLAVQEGAALSCPVKLRLKDAQGKPVRKAWVTIDDLLKYSIDVWGELAIAGLDAGTHTIRIDAPGYQSINSSLELKPGVPAIARDFTLTANR
jgi:N-acetylmuramoyl-L-alanine amidase